MPPRYIRFTIIHRWFWLLLNLGNILTSAAMAFGSVYILGKDQDKTSLAYAECQGMSIVCWALFTLHVINALFSLMALCNLEKWLCIGHVMLGLVVYDGIVLIWSQCIYFKSQKYNYNLEMTDLYFWLMGEILFFYLLTAFVICYFFRKFCQDPALAKELEDEERDSENPNSKDGAQTTDPGVAINTQTDAGQTDRGGD